MKSLLRLLLIIPLASSLSQATEYWIDFGTSSYARRYTNPAKKYAVRTTVAGWNNVSVTTQENAGSTSLSSSYFAETVAKDSDSISPTYGQTSVNSVYVYDTSGNAASAISLSITKDTSIGKLYTIESANAPSSDKFVNLPRPEWVPDSAYGDFIYTYENNGGSGAFVITLSGFKAGIYDLTIIAGGNSFMGSVSGGNSASAVYTLNGISSSTITGTDEAGGGYAGVLVWKGIEVDDNGVLSLKVEGGYLGNENGVAKYTGAAINTMMITMVPEPTTATLSLLALCGLAARRRRK